MRNLVGMLDITYRDPYLIRDCPKDAFDYVIDIGANTGQCASFCKFLFPLATIFSYEPCAESYKILCENLTGLDRMKRMGPIIFINKALGDNSDLYFSPSGASSLTCLGNAFKKHDTSYYKVKSVSIDNIFKENNIDTSKNILLKVDCEGGERYLMDDKYIPILSTCKQISMEVHFSDYSKFHNFIDLPKWAVYNEWIYRVFNDTHDILYHCGLKRKGVGVYVLTRKG